MKELSLQRLEELVEQVKAIEEPTNDEFLDLRYDQYTALVGHTNPYYRLFYLLAQELGPKRYVELGTDTGLALAHIAAGCSTCDCIGIDIWADSDEPMWKAQEVERHYANVRLIRSWTNPAAMRLWLSLHPEQTSTQIQWHHERGGPVNIDGDIDFLFIDAWHDKKLAMTEWMHYGLFLSDISLVVCDDITGGYLFVGMNEFWKTVSEGRPSLLDNALHPGVPMGIAIVTR